MINDDTQPLPIIDPDPPGGDPYNYIGAQVIWDVMTKNSERNRWRAIATCAEHLRSAPDAKDRFSLSV